jgi:vancomycin resistance protein VanJ
MIRVMTVNLCRGNADASAFRELIERHRPDVVGAQELGPDQAAVLEDHFDHGLVEPADDGEGRGLVARSVMHAGPLALPGRDGLRGLVTTRSGSLEVLAVHLLNPVDTWRGRAPHRRGQVAELRRTIAAPVPGPRLLIGDLNATPTWPAYRRLRRHLVDAVDRWSQATGARLPKTWSRVPGGRPVLRIDHVLTHGLEATAVSVVPVTGSDHRAVIADLVLSPVVIPADAAVPPTQRRVA